MRVEAIKELVQIREARIRHALRDQRDFGHVFRCDQEFMLEMMDRGLIGMDGFKFCEVIVAQTNRRIFLDQVARESV